MPTIRNNKHKLTHQLAVGKTCGNKYKDASATAGPATSDSSNINPVSAGGVGGEGSGGGMLAVSASLASASPIGGVAFFRGGDAGAPLVEAEG